MPTVLCVDVGNSFVKLALAANRAMIPLSPIETRTDPSFPKRIRDSLRGHPVDDIVGVIVSSVVPAINRPLAHTLFPATGRKPIFVDHTIRLPFRLRVAEPPRLGADRICAAAGAVAGRSSDAIVIDIGSAMTVDLVLKGGYRGGLIFAGPGLCLRALGAFAGRLPSIDFTSVSSTLPRRFDGTEASMVLGASIGALGALTAAVRHLERVAGRRVRKVATGGGLSALEKRLPASWKVRPQLVHEGLHSLWRLNRPDA